MDVLDTVLNSLAYVFGAVADHSPTATLLATEKNEIARLMQVGPQEAAAHAFVIMFLS